jgi:double-stranded uracil-DNA glycosylase
MVDLPPAPERFPLAGLDTFSIREPNRVAKQKASTRNAVDRMNERYPFRTLPDYLRPGLDLVFIGINPGLYSVQREHYFARSTSRFWPAFSASKLSERVRRTLHTNTLRPEHDAQLLCLGIGFTDVVKRPSANAADLSPSDFEKGVPRLLEKLQRYAPRVACFHGLTAYRPFLKLALRSTDASPVLGPQPGVVSATRLYVVPNPSPANAHFTLADQTAWYDRLADFLGTVNFSD